MKSFMDALRMLVVLTLITGLAYPLLITGVGKVFFSKEAEGSLITLDGKTVGSGLVGQKFSNPAYFWPRPSAIDYSPMPSSGSNLSATNKDLVAKVGGLRDSLSHIHPNSPKVPDDLLFASGSGLDPHISPEAALYQVERIAHARSMDDVQKSKLRELVQAHIEMPTLNLLGEPRVNVLYLNIALDSLKRINP